MQYLSSWLSRKDKAFQMYTISLLQITGKPVNVFCSSGRLYFEGRGNLPLVQSGITGRFASKQRQNST
mgnify:CR=1 FL=1